MARPKLMVCGYGRHGKDTFCDILSDTYGYAFQSSSEVANELIIWPQWGYSRYSSKEECFDDRHTGNNRSIWYNLIKDFGEHHPNALAKEIFSNNDIYCGIRNVDEFYLAWDSGLFDLSIWIDASERCGPESSDSCSITEDDCDIIITNNGTLDEFEGKIIALMDVIHRM